MYMNFMPELTENLLNSGIDNDEMDEEQSLRYNLINVVILLAAISSPIIGMLHLNQLYGYDSTTHAINCFIFSISQFLLLFFLRYSPTKLPLISSLLVISVFLIFTSNLIFSINENVRILWFVIFLTVSDFLGIEKIRNQAVISVVVLLSVFLTLPGLAVNLSVSDIFTSLLILTLWAIILHYYHFKLIKVQQHLKESESRQTKIFNSIVDGIINIDAKGVVESVNPAIEHMFGYNKNELIGNNINLLIPGIHTIQHDVFLQENSKLFAQKKDRSVFPMEILLNEVTINGKHMFAGIIRDISYQKNVEKEIINAKEEAERANNAKSDFLSRMSHELRTPLNAILGFGQLLSFESQQLNKEQESNVKEILDAGNHLLFLINEILDLAQIESGNVKMSIESVSVDQALLECTSLIQAQIADKQITLTDKVSNKGHYINADLHRFKQVLLNILSNAVKYNYTRGHINLGCKLILNTVNHIHGYSIQGHQQYLRIFITNTGEILTEDKINKLFIPFERLDASNEVEGTGIGLVITKHLIELMGGSIGIEADKDKGNTFWIEIPVDNDKTN